MFLWPRHGNLPGSSAALDSDLASPYKGVGVTGEIPEAKGPRGQVTAQEGPWEEPGKLWIAKGEVGPWG